MLLTFGRMLLRREPKLAVHIYITAGGKTNQSPNHGGFCPSETPELILFIIIHPQEKKKKAML